MVWDEPKKDSCTAVKIKVTCEGTINDWKGLM